MPVKELWMNQLIAEVQPARKGFGVASWAPPEAAENIWM